MPARIIIILLLLVHVSVRAQKKLLCLQEQVSVYYNVFKTGEEVSQDKWQIDIEVNNDATQTLYYKTRQTITQALEQGVQKIATEKSSTFLPKISIPLLGPYLKVIVQNEGNYAAPHYVHGAATLILTTDSTSILKVDRSRHTHSFDVLLPKDAYPIVEGEFITELLSLEEVKKKKLKTN